MAVVEYRPDMHGLGEILLGEELRAELRRHAEAAAGFARSNAPVGQPPDDKHPGAYRDSIHVVMGTSFHGTRAAARVVADVPYADQVETKHHVLARALDIGGG